MIIARATLILSYFAPAFRQPSLITSSAGNESRGRA